MREPIKLIDYKEELEYIKQERAKLDMRELGAYKEIRNLFQKQVEEYLKCGFRIFKIEKDGYKTVYGIVDRIEFANWNNGKRIMSSHINLYGLFLYYDSTQDFYNATNMSCLEDNRVFTIIDEMQDITLSELNEKITAWYIKANEEFLTEDEEFDPMPDWFFEANYAIFFKKYKEVLNNELINKEFEKYGNN